MKTKPAALFDLDGTLTDPKPGILNCINHALSSIGIEVPPSDGLISFIGPPLEESFLQLFNSDRAKAAEAVRIFRLRYSEVGLFENSVYPGILDILRELRKKEFRLFVATSKPQPFAERILRHFGLASYFLNTFGAQVDGNRKKKEDVIAHAMKVEKLDPEQTIMIGDTKYDAIGARTHSIPCIGVLWGYGSRSELEEAGVKFLCESPKDLPNIIECLVADNKT